MIFCFKSYNSLIGSDAFERRIRVYIKKLYFQKTLCIYASRVWSISRLLRGVDSKSIGYWNREIIPRNCVVYTHTCRHDYYHTCIKITSNLSTRRLRLTSIYIYVYTALSCALYPIYIRSTLHIEDEEAAVDPLASENPQTRNHASKKLLYTRTKWVSEREREREKYAI